MPEDDWRNVLATDVDQVIQQGREVVPAGGPEQSGTKQFIDSRIGRSRKDECFQAALDRVPAKVNDVDAVGSGPLQLASSRKPSFACTQEGQFVHTPAPASSSAICTALVAAPLRRLSETHQNDSPFG